jgi:hypothetical protein
VSFESTDVYIVDQSYQPVEAVLVRIFNPSGTQIFGQGTTDENGRASFLLPTQQYSMRFYKFGVQFSQPQLFVVSPAPVINAFTVHATTLERAISNDIRLCRCSGTFRDLDGSPQAYLDLHFYPEFAPIVVDDSAVVPRPVDIRTDENGFTQIDLYRGACYRVTIESLDNEERKIRVPDLPGANLPDVLFAVVDRIVLDPAGPYTLNPGDSLEITPTVYDSAGAVLTGTGQQDVDWRVSDQSVGSVGVGETKLTLRGVASGTAQLVATRHDLSIIKIPLRGIEGQPVDLTVL